MSDSIFQQSYFEIFSIAVSTQPDLDQLKETNRQLQQKVHPDRFANSSEEEKRNAMQITSLINQAFETLKKPTLRLQYMLSLKGVDMNAETDTSMDGAFLMQQMELREEIADIRSQSDPLDVLETMRADLKNESAMLIASFDAVYQQNALDEGREIIRKMQFLNKAQKEISDATIQLEDEFI
ncbi:Chaperone protein HscB [hydrothermal vent metagenome]|uniref:Chaperone protein HscB n=1 Tax=hydrothermal vent metagenome TaxID=652676 RepID=A0A3B0YBI8_9ZZZZ